MKYDNNIAFDSIDPNSIQLDDMDVSHPRMFGSNLQDAYFERLRREDPVHYCADSEAGPYWSITKFDDIKQIDTNHEVFSSEVGGITIANLEDDEELALENFIAMDPPKHDEQRRVVSPSVAPSNLKNFEPLIRERVEDILDNLPIGETFNWVDSVSIELTARMLATLFDFPYEDRRKLVRWSDVATAHPHLMGEAGLTHEERLAELSGCIEAFSEIWHERAAADPKFDLISMLAHGESTSDMITRPREFLGNLILLIVGGNDTTRNSISGGVLALNEYPDQYQKLRENHALAAKMIPEIIRWQTPLMHMRRTANQDIEFRGKKIREGDKVLMWYLSGNRDEDVFEDADKLIIDRPNARAHVAFGYGIHRCMGNRLAEMQLRVLWEEIMKRFDKVELVGEPKRLNNNFVRGIADLPVQLHPL